MVLAGLLLTAAPLAAITAGRAAENAQRQASARQGRHQVQAMLLGRGLPRLTTFPGGWTALSRPARWTAAGEPRTGRVPVTFQAHPGQVVRVWVSAAGRPAEPPPGGTARRLLVTLSAIGAALAVALALLLLAALGHWLFNRHRLAQWEREWQAADPRWRPPP
jgi:hypothetical protein